MASAHYFSKNPQSEDIRSEFQAALRGHSLSFITSRGVFSKDHLDKGSALLADSMMLPPKASILDIGCGIGVLGIAAAKDGCDVMMTDINERAVALAKENCKKNGVKATILKGDLYAPIKRHDFDVILSNPPQHAGKQVCFAIIEGAHTHLKEGGTLQLVARHNRGGETLSKKMEEVFGNVASIAKQSGFRVYLSRK